MTKTLFIGLDGATFTLLDYLTQEIPQHGIVMPFLRQFMAKGFRAVLHSTAHPLTPPAWTSLLTGRNPGSHGIFDFMKAKELGTDVFFTLYDFRDIQVETLWMILTRMGKKSVSLNFPMMAPPPSLNGVLIPGFTSWKHLKRNSLPEDLFTQLKEHVEGFDPKELAWDFERENEIGLEMESDYLAQWIRYHLPREEQWFRIAHWLFKAEKPDLMTIMFDGTDKIQHQAWHVLHPDFQEQYHSEQDQLLRTLCFDYFRRLDNSIAKLVQEAGDGVQVFMASDHGFTTSTQVVRINRYLGELGYLAWREVQAGEEGKRREASPFANLDWSKTLAYCRTPSSNAITIRQKRCPEDPGVDPADYFSFREKLIADLKNLKDSQGRAVIQAVLPREEVFSGEMMPQAPDLTLVLRDHGFVSIKNIDPVVEDRAIPAGTHHPDGIFLAGGIGIEPGYSQTALDMVDVAPTLLYSLGLPIPENFEGHPIASCFSAQYRETHPALSGPPTLNPTTANFAETSTTSSQEANTEENKEKILAQLKMLGYLEE